ncbi:hypothetical protein JTE90_021290 [Oedothorax gibbosus]|uniref:Uncharacterized protein n=1 Tax=Oedothorax gibbosus TaxID=931172 RepID=A0AAV6TTI0_9ARAC|nr:hypothetical protein JTE90_021290 [Oedothorax gibbosus]
MQSNQEVCIQMCVQERNYDSCGCVDPTFLIPATLNFSLCDLRNETDICCLDRVDSGSCDCPLPCVSTYYNEMVSTSTLMKSRYNNTLLDEYSNNTRTDEINLYDRVDLKMYYSTLESSVYQQKKMFEESELFSHLGGELGLWLGLSLVALFEMMDDAMYLLKFVISTACKTSKKDCDNSL